MPNKIKELTIEILDDLKELNKYIYNNPELGYEEFKSSKAHIELLKNHGFNVEENYLDIATAFRASYQGDKEGPTIAYLSEYDALPGIGHGCGHNLLGATNTGAGIVLKNLIDEIGGEVVVFGTPAEETSGAKVTMVNKGAFDDIDIAMEAHPAPMYYKSATSLALEAIEFIFHGKSSHAASDPEKGINALDGLIIMFNSINALREHILPSSRIHGVITNGGEAANIVPELAVAQFYVRASSKTYLNELKEKVINCAKGAALATGTTVDIRNFELSYDNLITNENLSNRFTENLDLFDANIIYGNRTSVGSLDLGNVSQVCPAIHPYFGILGNESIVAHTKEFRDATITPKAYENMVLTINALVKTGADVIKDKELLKKIKDEFNSAKK